MSARITVIACAALALGIGTSAGAHQTRDGGALPDQAQARTGAAVVSGIVLSDDASPRPVRRATVRLTGEALSSARLVGTDDDGRFAFDALPSGRYTLSVSKPGFVETFHGARRPWQGPGVPVAVTDGARAEVELRMLRGGVITGFVTDPFGKPARSIEVVAVGARSWESGSPGSWRATTDDRGEYRVFGLPPGDYLVSALPSLAEVDRGAPGRLVEESIVTTDAEARWALAAVAGSGGSLASAADPPPAGRPVIYAPVFYPGTVSPAAAAPVSVGPGEDRSGVGMALQIVPVARLEGVLIDLDGQEVSPATVAVHPRRRDRPSPADSFVASGALTMPRVTVLGPRFVAGGVPPGDYTLVARSGSATIRATVNAPPAAERLWAVLDVSVAGADRTDLVLRFAPGLQVAGEVRFEGSTTRRPQDLEGLELWLEAEGTGLGQASRARAVLDEDATFLFESLAPGAYSLRATLPSALTDAGWTLQSAMLDGRDIADQPITVEPGARNVDGLAVTFTDRPAAIAGRLIDAGDQPVTQYAIVVVTTDRSLWRPNARRIRAVPPATDGRFRVDGLPPGEYAVAAVVDVHDIDLSDPAFLSQLVDLGFTLTLSAGETAEQDLRAGGR